MKRTHKSDVDNIVWIMDTALVFPIKIVGILMKITITHKKNSTVKCLQLQGHVKSINFIWLITQSKFFIRYCKTLSMKAISEGILMYIGITCSFTPVVPEWLPRTSAVSSSSTTLPAVSTSLLRKPLERNLLICFSCSQICIFRSSVRTKLFASLITNVWTLQLFIFAP